MRKKIAIICMSLFAATNAFADLTELGTAIADAQASCVGISGNIKRLQVLAGVNTAVTGVGTVASGGALYAGIKKAEIDKEAENVQLLMMDSLLKGDMKTNEEFGLFMKVIIATKKLKDVKDDDPRMAEVAELAAMLEEYKTLKGGVLKDKSKKWGYWRTGLLAGGAVAGITGAIIAGKNKNDGADIKDMVQGCVDSVKKLRGVSMQAMLDGEADAGVMVKASEIIAACGKYTVKDFEGMPKWSEVAMWSSIAAGATGVAGTATSIVANTEKIRERDKTDMNKRDQQAKAEKGWNMASNVLAGASAVTGAVATGFNIAALANATRLIGTAEECESSLD
jgi:hypothetical protein